MALQAIADVRNFVVIARDAAFADIDLHLALQRIVDALDRLHATLHRLQLAPVEPVGTEIGQTAEELEAALEAGLPLVESALQMRLEGIATMFYDAVASVAWRTRSGYDSRRVAREVSNGARVGKVNATSPRAPLPTMPRVLFGASAPSAATTGSRFVAQFAAYPEDAADAARALLAEAQPQARMITGVGGDALAFGTVVEVALSGAGLTVEGMPRDVQRIVWTGHTTQLGFEVHLAVDAKSTVLRYDVMVDGILLAKLRLPLEVSTAPKPAPLQSAEAFFAKTAFASYSSKDRQRVLDRVAAIRIAAKVDVFLDCHDLNPGGAWEPNLARAIDGCDTFLLFWSDAAAQSPWVQWEWTRALIKPGLDGMQFHPLENGVKPPRELAAIHLGDPYMDLRVADRVRRVTAMTGKETT